MQIENPAANARAEGLRRYVQILTVLAFALLDQRLVLDVFVTRLAVEPGPVTSNLCC